jgi:chemotaxis family two-component system response regulator Rcp1
MNCSQRINILLVEDSESDASLILHTFQQSPLPEDVHHVPTGEDALAALHAGETRNGTPYPDMILLDLKLPGLDGFDILQRVKTHNEWKSIPVIVVTSSALEEDIHRAMSLEADLYLSKPLDLEGYSDLVKEIEEFWTNRGSAE